MGRLKPGVSLEQANAALRDAAARDPRRRRSRADDESFLEDPLTLVSASTGRSPLRNRFETPLRAMQATVAVVLLIACASLANLMLARALARRRELSVRLALGASRWRVTRLLAVETAVIVAAGAALGVLFAKWSSALLVQQLATWRGSVFLDLSLDWRVLGFTAGLAAVTAVIAGIVPALSVTGVAPGDAMKESSRTVTGDRRLSVRGALVVAQIALSLVLVVGAGLFLRTFAALSATPLGFAAGGLTVATVNLPAAVAEPAARRDLLERLDAAIAAAPGVRAAGLSVIAPITGSGWNDQIGTADGPPTAARRTYVNAVTPQWFETMGIRRLSGRDFDRSDRLGAPDVTIVNETFARKFLAGRPPIGQRITAGGPRDRKEFEVVGVVSDAVYRSLREGVVPTMYLPLAAQASPGSRITLTLSTSTAARSTVDRLLADTLRGVDPGLTFSIRDFDQFIRGGLIQERLVAMLSGFFGGLALLIAAIGLYGVVAHAVDVRRTEIGVRIALGADRLGILVLVFRRVAVMLALGLAAGLALSLWASRFVGALLFRLEPRDVTTFAGALTVLDRGERAGRVDPGAAGVPYRSGPGPARRLIAVVSRDPSIAGRGRQDREAPDALAQRPLADARESQQVLVRRRRAEVEALGAGQVHALPAGLIGGTARGESHHQEHTGGVAQHGDLVAEVPGQRRRQRLAAAFIEAAHATDVALEMALAQEVGERGLLEDRGAAIGMPLRAGERRRRAAAAPPGSRGAGPGT